MSRDQTVTDSNFSNTKWHTAYLMTWFAKAAYLSSKFYSDWFRSSHLIAEFISISHSDFTFLTGEMSKILVVLLIVCLASLQSSAIRPRWITRWVKTIIISPASLLFDHIPSWWNLPLHIILYYISLTFITTTNYENSIFQANEEDQIA